MWEKTAHIWYFLTSAFTRRLLLVAGHDHERSSRVSQCAKSLKSQSFHPKSHYFGQTYLKIAKILKINAYLGVAHLLQSYCTAVCSETSWQNGLCLKITLPKLQIT